MTRPRPAGAGHTGRVRIDQASADDVLGLAALLWFNHHGEAPVQRDAELFAGDLAGWWDARRESHVGFVARVGEGAGELVGMAWLALVHRVPRPGTLDRLSADIQSVFVLPDHRGNGVGSALVEAAAARAVELGALNVTVHSGERAVPVYERLGFASSPELLQLTPDDRSL